MKRKIVIEIVDNEYYVITSLIENKVINNVHAQIIGEHQIKDDVLKVLNKPEFKVKYVPKQKAMFKYDRATTSLRLNSNPDRKPITINRPRETLAELLNIAGDRFDFPFTVDNLTEFEEEITARMNYSATHTDASMYATILSMFTSKKAKPAHGKKACVMRNDLWHVSNVPSADMIFTGSLTGDRELRMKSALAELDNATEYKFANKLRKLFYQFD